MSQSTYKYNQNLLQIGMMIQWSASMLVLSLFFCQATTLTDITTTDYPWFWPCIPEDGSPVPDCSKYVVDPYPPAYVEHAYSE